jgi:4-amino-4-deoxy-L-arabinose transferase-like glycosyltransferase
MTGTVATQSYVSPTTPPPSLFSTLWSGIDLPALWFWVVAVFLKLGGTSLAVLRLPAALFGAATVVPLYALLRETWGRSAAIAGTAIMAFSISNVHYSRLALNNIVTQFFWATCFFFLLCALRSRRPSDWALAGLSAGLSEYFYHGTRLLPFILAVFMMFLLAVHWKQARQYASGFLVLAGSYFVGFGPLLLHFIRNPNLYLGRGASLLSWSPHIPISFADLHGTWKTIWPALSENLLGISTHSSQDIIFYAPLLLPAEAALLVLGVALLLWHWASSSRISHTRLRAKCFDRGRNAGRISEQRPTADQSLDSCFPSLLCRVGCAHGPMVNSRTIGGWSPGCAGSCRSRSQLPYSCLAGVI